MTPGLDVLSPTWRAVQQYANAEVERLRTLNDSPTLDATHTALIRGRLVAWKQLLALANPAPAPQDDAGAY